MRSAAMIAVGMTAAGLGALTGAASGDEPAGQAPTSSLMARALAKQPVAAQARPGANVSPLSLFAVEPPDLRQFAVHELVQIIVRETSTAKRSQSLNAKKEWAIDGKIAKWPNFQLSDLLQMQIAAGTAAAPELDMDFNKDFKGKGDYNRKDDMTDRLTAEIVEIMPNGNLVLEARTSIKTDEESSVMKVTGVCRPADITPANTVLSNQIHDLSIEKFNTGELKRTSEKGIIARVLEAVFAF
jgi:flagellar L-ring protein precursor FlgH